MARLKGKSWGWLALAALVLAGRTEAQEPRVLLLSDPAAPTRHQELAQALRIQLIGRAKVEVRSLPPSAGVSGRVQAAAELVGAEGALLVVWAEPTVTLPDGSREAVLYVVGQQSGRALIEIVRVQGGESPDVDRSLALKVGEVVDEVQRARAAAAEHELALEPAIEPRAGPSPVETDRTAPTPWGATLGVGAAIGPRAGLAQVGVRADAGAAFRVGSLRLSTLLELSYAPELEVQAAASQVRFEEVGPGLLLRVQLRQGGLWLGARAGLALSFVDARATGAAGDGDVTERVTSVVTGLDVEMPLGHGIALAAGAELHTALRRQRFTVAGDPAVDLGRVRPVALFALRWSAADLH